jgi:hypothetical protein
MSNYQNYLIQTALDAHNKLGEQHVAPPLKHNPDLSKTALKWAEYLAKNNKFEHSTNDQRKYKDSTIWVKSCSGLVALVNQIKLMVLKTFLFLY